MQQPITAPTFVLGDLHGHLPVAIRLLQAAGLIDAAAHWRADEATLLFIGDFCDRGPDGIGALELAMRLQLEAAAVGGRVAAVLGNHDALLIAVHRFGELFRAGWLQNGGQPDDLARFTARHLAWLSTLPMLLRHGDALLVHADALFITDYGATIREVNVAVHQVLFDGGPEPLGRLLDQFDEHLAFTGRNGAVAARDMLARYGGTQIIHGHSPISYGRQVPPAAVTAAWSYAHGRCVNVDGGLYLGGPGFVYQLPVAPTARQRASGPA